MTAGTNVLRDALAAERLLFMQRCWISLLTFGAVATLLAIDWRIALAFFALTLARNTMERIGGRYIG